MDAALLSRPNPSSGTPIYIQLVDQVRRGLETGALRPGDALPAICPLAEALVVPPAAVARAYRELEERRLAVRTGGVLYTAAPISSRQADQAATTESALRARELQSAEEVQRCLLPRSDVPMEGLDYAGVSRAAQAVGGDYYDFVPLPCRKVAIALGDVCGKGVPAAILMAAIRGYLHGATVERQGNPRDFVTALNRHLHASVPASRFATFFYGVYDVSTRTLDYVTAGHHPPVLIRRDGHGTQRVRLTAGGLALGMMPDARYESGRVVLERGDVLVVFTDGITEAMSATGEEWGEDRLIDDLEAHEPTSAGAIAERVLGAARDFSRGLPQHDDMTVAVVRVL
jgi:sigma-B regulation protein RsbU (phosphoserine phosphatase)